MTIGQFSLRGLGSVAFPLRANKERETTDNKIFPIVINARLFMAYYLLSWELLVGRDKN